MAAEKRPLARCYRSFRPFSAFLPFSGGGAIVDAPGACPVPAHHREPLRYIKRATAGRSYHLQPLHQVPASQPAQRRVDGRRFQRKHHGHNLGSGRQCRTGALLSA